jgi:hypothetical protein
MDYTFTAAQTDAAAAAFRSAIKLLAVTIPGSFVETGPNGTLLAVTHAAVPALNAVLSSAATPDAAEIAALAETAAKEAGQAPWSIRIRTEPSTAIRQTADKHGLTTAAQNAFMLLPLADRREVADIPVRRVKGVEFKLFAQVLGEGLGAPPAVVEPIYTARVLDQPGISAYVAEDEHGTAVSAGVSFLNDGYLGIGNFATLPRSQGGGHWRAIAETMLRDGSAAGAHTAYAHAADTELAFYGELEFRNAGSWTTLSVF